jgi:hypothetical protein
MEHYTATMLNWSLALGAYALGGLLWAALVFLGVAVVRLALELQRLRHRNAELALESQRHPRTYFNDTGYREARPTRVTEMSRRPMPSQA